jgi:hypothetical protein
VVKTPNGEQTNEKTKKKKGKEKEKFDVFICCALVFIFLKFPRRTTGELEGEGQRKSKTIVYTCRQI